MLALACCLLVATSTATTAADVDSEICAMKTFGNTSDFPILVPVRLRTVTLAPPVVTWDLDLPQWCAGYCGVRVRVCDSDAEPTVRVSALSKARVVRTGAVHTVAKVHVTQYCDMRHGALKYASTNYDVVANPSV